MISIHALLAESDLNFHHRRPCCFQFLSTLSLRRATSWATRARAAQLFLSTLSLRRATNSRHNFGPKNRFLSTLSLRRATQQPENTADEPRFLSTLSLRRATSFDFCIICLPSYFYPRSPCGERQLCEGNRAAEPYFYPRSPCGERLQSLTYGRCVLHFYPRSPCGERLCWFEELDQFDGISIHALLAESDLYNPTISL